MPLKDSTDMAYFREKQAFFASGATLGYKFRIAQLKAFKAAIKKRESAVADALRADFGKPAFESYMTETGLLHEEISHAIRKLARWMKSGRVISRIAMFPTRFEVRKVPKGIVLVIGPWNYPLQLALCPVIGAMAAGNCVVLKPSHVTANVSELLLELIGDTFDKNYISAVGGPGSSVVPELMSRHRFDHIFFTGSPAVGKSVGVAAVNTHSSVTLELGGKSPAIVDASADIRNAARRIVWGKCVNAGQSCVAPDYVLVHRDVKADFVRYATESIREYYGTDPEKSPDFARIINDKRYKILESYVKSGTILSGGRCNPASRYIEPTLLDESALDSPVMIEEIFGPILPVISFSTEDEALAIIEKNPFPLALYLFSANRQSAERFFTAVRFGGGCLNNTIIHFAEPRVPIGGTGNSGVGNYHGKRSFDAFSQEKTLAFSSRAAMNSLIFPPYTKAKETLLRFFLK